MKSAVCKHKIRKKMTNTCMGHPEDVIPGLFRDDVLFQDRGESYRVANNNISSLRQERKIIVTKAERSLRNHPGKASFEIYLLTIMMA